MTVLDKPASVDAGNAGAGVESEPLLLFDQVVWTAADRLSGAPCFYHSRVPIKTLFDYLEGGESVTTFLDEYPGVTHAQVVSAIYYGKAQLMPPGVPQPTGKTRTVPQPIFAPAA